MQTSKLAKICEFYNAGALLQAIPIDKPGLLHLVLRLQTSEHDYLMKRYSVEEKNQLVLIKDILKLFSQNNIQISQPICTPAKLFFEDEKYLWVLFPWIEGKHLEVKDITKKHIQIIAKIIGKIHSLSFLLPRTLPIISADVDEKIFSHSMLKNFDLTQCYTEFLSAKKMLDQNLAISHGDLLPANVIWRTANKPILIDWDNCGLLNQDIDLFNTAINWAGIERGWIDMDRYWLFMDIYHRAYARPITISPEHIHASFGSWLQWLTLMVKKMPNKRAAQQLDITLKALRYLSENAKYLAITLA
jgi:Ser/Thr protein kinase RdoA (MazF antagonist)